MLCKIIRLRIEAMALAALRTVMVYRGIRTIETRHLHLHLVCDRFSREAMLIRMQTHKIQQVDAA